MTYDEALHFFEIESDFQSIELLDIIDERLFQIKNEVLQKFSVPQLLEKRIKECQRIIEGQAALSMLETPILPEFPDIQFPLNPIAFLEYQERMLSISKLQIHNAKQAQTLEKGILFIKELQETYHHLFIEVMKDYAPFNMDNVVASHLWDSGPIIRELKQNQLSELSIQAIKKEGARISKLSML